MTEKDDLLLSCSFCGKLQNEVTKLAVNGDYTCAVCNECAQVVVDMAEDEDERQQDR